MSKPFLAALIGSIAVASAAAFFYFSLDRSPALLIDPSDKDLVTRGEAVYAKYCAACHGSKLEGQPGWRTRLANGRLLAPPHDSTGHTWHHPDEQLFDIVKNGLLPGRTAPPGYESDMPAYSGILSDSDIIAVLAYIKSQWPKELRELQQEVNLRSQDRN